MPGTFDESKHPRNKGKFTSGPGGSAKAPIGGKHPGDPAYKMPRPSYLGRPRIKAPNGQGRVRIRPGDIVRTPHGEGKVAQ